MKIAPIIDAINVAQTRGGSWRFRLIHTGQHYDRAMPGSFFEELGIPHPDINLEVGSGTHAEQPAAIMVAYEKVLLKENYDLCLVVRDVSSTMACSIVSRKLGVPVAHVKGGIYSGDWTMPEEINRVVTDTITNWFLTTSETANDNLRHADVTGYCIFFVVTLHCPANVDGEQQLLRLLQAIAESMRGLPVVFPVHPRTAKNLRELDITTPQLNYVDPLSYLEFNYLVQYAAG